MQHADNASRCHEAAFLACLQATRPHVIKMICTACGGLDESECRDCLVRGKAGILQHWM